MTIDLPGLISILHQLPVHTSDMQQQVSLDSDNIYFSILYLPSSIYTLPRETFLKRF